MYIKSFIIVLLFSRCHAAKWLASTLLSHGHLNGPAEPSHRSGAPDRSEPRCNKNGFPIRKRVQGWARREDRGQRAWPQVPKNKESFWRWHHRQADLQSKCHCRLQLHGHVVERDARSWCETGPSFESGVGWNRWRVLPVDPRLHAKQNAVNAGRLLKEND
jgi:hypothetical protein